MARTLWSLVLLALAGCSSEPQRYTQVPLPANHPVSTQLELQAVQHWRILAASIATATRSLIDSDPAASAGRYRVEPAVPPTAFSEALHTLLVTELVKAGVAIAPDAPDAVALRYEIQLLEFGPGRETGYWVYTGGENLPPELGIDDPSQLSAHDVQRYELLVTTSIVRDGNYWLRRSDIHYVRDRDAGLYRTATLERRRRLIDLVRAHEAQRLDAEGWPHYAAPR
jgi:hypothetical protein